MLVNVETLPTTGWRSHCAFSSNHTTAHSAPERPVHRGSVPSSLGSRFRSQLRIRPALHATRLQRDHSKLRCLVTDSDASFVKAASNWRSSALSGLLQAVAAATILAQPIPAWAGEVIQGVPRVADGDTLQVRYGLHVALLL